MKNFVRLVLICGLVLSFSAGLWANGLNLNGNGTKAISMGGAFIGLADDYSAVFWNPAGLTQMKNMQLSLFLVDVIPSATYAYPAAGIDTGAENRQYFSGSLGFFKPISDNVVAGIYAYVPSGLGSEWPGEDLAALSGGAPFLWESMLGVITVSPAVAIKFSDVFSLGLSVNINYGMLDLKRPTPVGQYEEDLDGIGIGATIGIMIKPSDKVSFGLTYKTPFKAKLSGESYFQGAPAFMLPNTDDAERETTFPQWIGAGICVTPTDKLTFTLDVQYTNWKELDTIPISFTNPGWIAAFEADTALHLKWKDATQIRFGMEYKVSDAFAIRAGYYNDPQVTTPSTMNILLPELGYNWFTFGFGYKKGKISLDFAIEFAFGTETTVTMNDVLAGGGVAMPGIHGMNIVVPNLSLTINL